MYYFYYKIKSIVDQFNFKGVKTNYIYEKNVIKPTIVYSHVTGKPIFMDFPKVYK